MSDLGKIRFCVTKKTRQLQNDLISDTDRTTDNVQFTFKTRPFTGPSHQKLSKCLEQQHTDTDEDTNDYYQIIHNSFLLELMKQSGGGGYYTRVAMRRLDEDRVYYEHKKKKKKQEKKQLTNETFDSRPTDRMSLGIDDDDTLDDSYISGAY
ncbi:hypothetical protein I4U23_027187 [Adineta vaga]|nr:hypothetical protein I4U23_027187 [Adineta vaga]